MLSRSFIEDVIVEWLQSQFNGLESTRLSATVTNVSREAVKALELWAPIAHLEVQAPFALGPAQIAPVSKGMIDGLESAALSSGRAHRSSI